jgi:hypothetical protein
MFGVCELLCGRACELADTSIPSTSADTRKHSTLVAQVGTPSPPRSHTHSQTHSCQAPPCSVAWPLLFPPAPQPGCNSASWLAATACCCCCHGLLLPMKSKAWKTRGFCLADVSLCLCFCLCVYVCMYIAAMPAMSSPSGDHLLLRAHNILFVICSCAHPRHGTSVPFLLSPSFSSLPFLLSAQAFQHSATMLAAVTASSQD